MPDDDTLTLSFTRRDAHQLLIAFHILDAIRQEHAPTVDVQSAVVGTKLGELQAFVEGTREPQ